MDDNTPRLRAEFPLGESLKIIASEPTPAQQLVLSLTRAPKDGDSAGTARMVRRLFGVMEKLVGSDVWYDVIEEALIQESVNESQLVQFCEDVLSFNWSAHRKQRDQALNVESVEPAVTRSAPRVIDSA